MKVDKLRTPCILTVLCGTEDNLVKKQLYVSEILTCDGSYIHMNGFVSARVMYHRRFYPFLTNQYYVESRKRYEFGYVYWNGVAYENLIIDIQSIFEIPKMPRGFDHKFTLCELIEHISKMDEYEFYEEDNLYYDKCRSDIESCHLHKCIDYVKETLPYAKVIAENIDGSDFRI